MLGDYLEFGCFHGDSFVHAYNRAAPLLPWMRFWAFDSFQGLPQLSGIDSDGEFWEGQFSCDEHTFMQNLQKANVDLERVNCIPGWFADTLTSNLKQKKNLQVASIVYIDCDLYHSTVPVLDFITDLVETGTVIMFDDWFCFKADPQKGVQKACSEWLQRNPRIKLHGWHLFGPYGKSFITFIN
ncbi:MAG: TylF/MycF/NovP-related O-methyltransferase [Caldilineaceae bacterium]